MYQHMSAEFGRTRQSDLRAAAARRRMVTEARGERVSVTARFRTAFGRAAVRRESAVAAPTPVRPAITPAN